MKRLPILGAALLALALPAAAVADDLELTIGYQTVVEPSKVPQADGAYDKATGAAIDWRKFDSGADVIAAIASGALDIGYVGSSPLAAAASRELPIETIFVVGLIGESEALVARDGSGVARVADLVGKKVAVPFVSTTHYSLLAALKHEGIDPKKVEILNLRPPEIAAAWERGDIDAAYVWDPGAGPDPRERQGDPRLPRRSRNGAPRPSTPGSCARTSPRSTPMRCAAFVEVTGESYANFLADPAAWSADSDQAKEIARLTGAKVEDVPLLLKGYVFPTLARAGLGRLPRRRHGRRRSPRPPPSSRSRAASTPCSTTTATTSPPNS